jgi:hypothetical protein
MEAIENILLKKFCNTITEKVGVAVMIQICIQKLLHFTHDRAGSLPEFEFLWFSSDHPESSHDSTSNRTRHLLRSFTIQYPPTAPPYDVLSLSK